MNLCWKTIFCLCIVVAGPASAGDKWLDDFFDVRTKSRPVVPLPDKYEQGSDRVSAGPDDAGNQYARITVDSNSLGGNVCRKAAPDDECGKPIPAFSLSSERARARAAEPDRPKLLAPSFIEDPKITPVAAIDTNGDPYCDSAIMQKALAAGEEGGCIQRQELRLQSLYTHAADEPFTYKLRFRMPAVIQDTKSCLLGDRAVETEARQPRLQRPISVPTIRN